MFGKRILYPDRAGYGFQSAGEFCEKHVSDGLYFLAVVLWKQMA